MIDRGIGAVELVPMSIRIYIRLRPLSALTRLNQYPKRWPVARQYVRRSFTARQGTTAAMISIYYINYRNLHALRSHARDRSRSRIPLLPMRYIPSLPPPAHFPSPKELLILASNANAPASSYQVGGNDPIDLACSLQSRSWVWIDRFGSGMLNAGHLDRAGFQDRFRASRHDAARPQPSFPRGRERVPDVRTDCKLTTRRTRSFGADEACRLKFAWRLSLDVVRIDCERCGRAGSYRKPAIKEAVAFTARDLSLRGSIAWCVAPR
jgi:hypothetical protein